MKPRNVMLLGFINSAVEYLDRHMDEEPDARLLELKNIDLASLRDEIVENMDASLGTMQSTMSTLLKAGNEAFDRFIVDVDARKTIVDQFDQIFDVDFDSNKKSNQEQLAKLLSYYNLDSDFDIDDSIELDTNTNDEYIKHIQESDPKQVEQKPIKIKADEGIDSIFDEIVKNESKKNNVSNKKQEIKKEVKKNNKPIEKNIEPKTNKQSGQDYIKSLITDLKVELDKKEKEKKKTVELTKDGYDRISKAYPYVPSSFIYSAYVLKDSLNDEYPYNKNVIVLHRVQFIDVEQLRKFCEILLNHDYLITADEDKMIVDVFKTFKNESGKILANIYEVANQGYLLEGTYEGYNVIVNEE